MSFTQTLIGGSLVAVMATGLLQLVLPAPAPFVIHSLTYADGMVMQDRTIAADGPLYAEWTARVVVADDGPGGYDVVPDCDGSGSYPYRPGRKVATLSLQEWVGNPACHPPPGVYRLVVAWRWGAESTGMESDIFEVKR